MSSVFMRAVSGALRVARCAFPVIQVIRFTVDSRESVARMAWLRVNARQRNWKLITRP